MLYHTDEPQFQIYGANHYTWAAAKGLRIKRRGFSALALRVRGKATISCGEKPFTVTPSELIFLPQGVDYHADYTETELYAIHFVLLGDVPCEPECYTLPDTNALLPLFRRACKVWQGKGIGYKTETHALLLEILVTLRRQMADVGEASPGFLRAIQILLEEYTRSELSIGEACLRAGISDSYFRRQCRTHFGASPLAYLTELRLAHAEHLLRLPFYSVERVAEESGFCDAKYFARVVRKARGCSPTQLRYL